jgi:hypothetical protein
MLCYEMRWTEQEFNSQKLSFIYRLLDWMEEKAKLERKEIEKNKL